MANLFPESYDEETMDVTELVDTTPVGYRPGVAFDLKTGDFVRDGRNQLMESTGVDSWKQWVLNCIQTERYKHLAYNSDYGVEWDKVFGSASHEEAESILTRQISEAIMADPYGRAAYIDEIDFEWTNADSIVISATIVGIDDITIDITLYMTKGES